MGNERDNQDDDAEHVADPDEGEKRGDDLPPPVMPG